MCSKIGLYKISNDNIIDSFVVASIVEKMEEIVSGGLNIKREYL